MVYTLPLIAGHVGADATAAILSEGPHRREPVQLLVDVGTNAEIVLGNKDRLLAASSPTGPAFEGAQISSGQRAAPGAIERVRIDRATFEPRIRVIGQEMWSDEEGFDGSNVTGICGSGIIEVIAELFLAGVIDSDGVLRPQSPEVSRIGLTRSHLFVPLVGEPPNRDHPERRPRHSIGEGGAVCRGPPVDGSTTASTQVDQIRSGGSLREPHRSALRDDPRHDPRLPASTRFRRPATPPGWGR